MSTLLHHFRNKKILMGITGSIAAYKAIEIIRLLREAHAEVRVVLTEAAKEFVTPLTLQAISGMPVHEALFDAQMEAAMGHIELSRWADLVLIAPASADIIARLAQGHANDLLTTLCLATRAPIWIAPAMNEKMWAHPATQKNCTQLTEFGMRFIPPGFGVQACGDIGYGRMAEPNEIIQQLTQTQNDLRLNGLKIVITAGPTQEALDPIRYLSNQSSGKMGFALAETAARAGAMVTLIAGPVQQLTPENVKRIDVISAEEMHHAVLNTMHDCDWFIATAAVADYRPAEQHLHKIKKTQEEFTIRCVKNPDIVRSVTQLSDRPWVVAFAAETEELAKHAKQKLLEKNVDMIAANLINEENPGFDVDYNQLTVFSHHQERVLTQKSKTALAVELLHLIKENFDEKNSIKSS